jgi:hypothetical protein
MALNAIGFYQVTYDGHVAVGYCQHLGPTGTDAQHEHWTILYEAPGSDGLMHANVQTYDPVHGLTHGWTVGSLITSG